MYRVIIYEGPNDGTGIVIHSPYVSSQKLTSGVIKQFVSGIDSMDFTINMTNKAWGVSKPLTTLIKVLNIKTGTVEFEGRILKPKQTMSSNGLFSIQYECESFEAYLLDSSQRHGEYHNISIAPFLQIILDNHNSQVEPHKRFKLGNVTVTNTTDNVYRYLGYENTYDTIKDKLLDRLGGYLVVRNESDGLYLDYLAEVGEQSDTVIRLRRNLKDMSREIDPTEVITRLVPLGAQIDSTNEESTDASKARVDIKSVNNGIDYIDDQKLIAEFGIIEKAVTFDDINQPNILKTRGNQFMSNQKISRNGFELTPLDLSLNDLEADGINKGDWYRIENPVFGINEPLQVIQKDLNIVNPLDIKITVGEKFKTLTEYQVELNKGLKRYDTLNNLVVNQVRLIGGLKTELKDVNDVITNINIDIRNENFPGMKQSIESLNAIVDVLNQSIGNIPIYVTATENNNGLMTAQHVIKLNLLQNYGQATGLVDGLLSKEDKQKLNRITANQSVDLDQLVTDFLALKTLVEGLTE